MKSDIQCLIILMKHCGYQKFDRPVNLKKSILDRADFSNAVFPCVKYIVGISKHFSNSVKFSE